MYHCSRRLLLVKYVHWGRKQIAWPFIKLNGKQIACAPIKWGRSSTARALPCHGRGCAFESRRSRHIHPRSINTIVVNVASHNWFTQLSTLSKMYYFYILRSLSNKKLYLGYTKDLKNRIQLHNSGSQKSTKPNIPYKLMFYSGFVSKKDALACEKYFKTTAGWRRLKQMLKVTLKD